MRVRRIAFVACVGGLVGAGADAKVGPEQAKQLGGPVLTEFGAERAGNADGSIPAYQGGLTSAPPGISVTASTDSSQLPDPYASDRVLYTVDASNLARYRNLVTAGTAAVIGKYPTFHLNVYPSHRSAAYPAWVLRNTIRNAMTAELVGPIEGDGVAGAYGGIPFPIPKNGYEVLWNNYLHWAGVSYLARGSSGLFIDASGHVTISNTTNTTSNYPYYNQNASSVPDGYYQDLLTIDTAPAEDDGTQDILKYPLNYATSDQLIYFYTVGTRRVRLAPEFKYDTPIAQDGGALLFDEIDLFIGRPDRFDFKLVGKKELLIPYNNFKFNPKNVTIAEFLPPHHFNPDLVRWEKHRVWVVDATLKPGQRHVYARRTFYADEDTWNFIASDSYDHAGVLYRVGYKMLFPVYNAPYPVQYGENFVFLNLDRGSYAFQNWYGGHQDADLHYYPVVRNQNMFNPENMANTGIR